MSVSQLAKSIAESPTLRLNEQARLLREKGEAVVHLGAGEPKNKAPIAAILAAASKLNTGDVKYTPADGTPGLKKQIIRYTEENYDRVVAPENVIVSAGAEAVGLQHPLLGPEPAGRGRHPRPVLGQLPRDGEDVLRRPGHREGRGRRLRPPDGGHREVRRLRDARHHLQQPEQPLGRPLPRQPDRRARRLLRAQGDLADHGRHLPQARLRREEVAELLQVHEEGHRDVEGHRRQRRLEALRHDRLPDRLGDRAAAARPDHDERPGADHDDRLRPPPGGGRGGAVGPPERRREPPAARSRTTGTSCSRSSPRSTA